MGTWRPTALALAFTLCLWGCRGEPTFPVNIALSAIQGAAPVPAAAALWVTPEAVYLSPAAGEPGLSQGTGEVHVTRVVDLKDGRVDPSQKTRPEQDYSPISALMEALERRRTAIRSQPNSLFTGDLNLFVHPSIPQETIGLLIYTAGMATFMPTGFAVGAPGAVTLVPLDVPLIGDRVKVCRRRSEDAPPVSEGAPQCLQLEVSIHDDGFRVQEEGTVFQRRPQITLPRHDGGAGDYDYEALYQTLKERYLGFKEDDISHSFQVGATPDIPVEVLIKTITTVRTPRTPGEGAEPVTLFARTYLTAVR